MAINPPIPLHDATGETIPTNNWRGALDWGELTMQTPRFELIYESWGDQQYRPTEQPIVAFTDWSDVQAWAASIKNFVENTAGYDNTYTGWLCYDYEDWPHSWEWAKQINHSTVAKTRAAARALWPILNRMTADAAEAAIGRAYNKAVARILCEIDRQVRSLCPSAQFAWYDNTRTTSPTTATDAIIADINDRVLYWRHVLADAVTISIYCFHKTVDSNPGPGERTVAGAQAWMTTAATECVRVATAYGKDALIFVWDQYHGSNTVYGGDRVQDQDMDMQMQTAVDAGADGMLFWHAFTSTQDVTDFNLWVASNLEGVVSGLGVEA